MCHRSRRCNFFDLQGNGVCLVCSHPNGKHCFAVDVLENDYWSPTVGIHHQRTNLDLDFHVLPRYCTQSRLTQKGLYYLPIETVWLCLCHDHAGHFSQLCCITREIYHLVAS